MKGIKKPAQGRFFASSFRLSCQSFDLSVQTALMTSSLVFMDDAFVSHAIDNWHSSSVLSLGHHMASVHAFAYFLGCTRFLLICLYVTPTLTVRSSLTCALVRVYRGWACFVCQSGLAWQVQHGWLLELPLPVHVRGLPNNHQVHTAVSWVSSAIRI